MSTFYGRRYFDSSDFLAHAYYDKDGQKSVVGKSTNTQSSGMVKKRNLNGTSISKEKGTDGKANNTSAYNHDYYVHHKDKWNVKTEEYSDGDSDFYDWDEKDRIGDTDFFAFKDKNGNWVIGEEDQKWKLPEGTELTSGLKKKLVEISKQSFSNPKEFQAAVEKALNDEDDSFDIDAAARDVIRGKYKNSAERRAALGDDYEMVQKRVNEMYKEGKIK